MKENEWTVGNIERGEGDEDGEEPSTSNNAREKRYGRRLDIFMKRVRQRMDKGEELLSKRQQGEEYTSDDELAIEQLDKALDTFVKELMVMTQNGRFHSSEEEDECTAAQIAAEDLLVAIKGGRKSQTYSSCDLSGPRFNANTTSRLPNIDLVHFDGNKLKWFEFWAHFKSQVDGRQDVADVVTDSQIVLSWMKSEKLLQPFVSRRIAEIKSFPYIAFRYVNSKENPADLATRGHTSPLPQLWLKGPAFLSLQEKNWPSTPTLIQSGNFAVVNAEDQPPDTDQQGSTVSVEDIIPLRPMDVIRETQQIHFPKEVDGHSTHLSKSLDLYKDEHGILRCKGRLQNALLSHDQKFPILLPRDDSFTLEIIRETHEKNYHVGVSQTLALLRKRFWIPKGRSQVMYVIRRCDKCVKYGGGPYKLPPMPPLPPERVQLCHPFIYTGLDYLGPLTVQEKGIYQKRWCCIFTCMASRAIRLEVIKSLSADEFLLCLRRFIAAQGVPALLVSDNAAQFRLAAEILQSPICKDNNIAWHFIPELAPWQGGFYERLVGMVKHCLRRTLDKTIVSDSQLGTIFKEIETVLNSRPLTTVGENLEHVLTPSDFLSSCGTRPLFIHGDSSASGITATKADLIEGWKKGQCVLDEFAKMFSDHYLPSLRERALNPHRQPRVLHKSDPVVGDVVQLWDDRSKTSNRAHWKVGKIVSLVEGTDGKVRTAKVELDSGQVFTRSIAHLYPLELSTSEAGGAVLSPPPLATQARDMGQPGPSNEASASTDTSAPATSPSPPTITPLAPPAVGPEVDTASVPPTAVVPLRDDADASASTRPSRGTKAAAMKLIRQWTRSLAALANVESDASEV